MIIQAWIIRLEVELVWENMTIFHFFQIPLVTPELSTLIIIIVLEAKMDKIGVWLHNSSVQQLPVNL